MIRQAGVICIIWMTLVRQGQTGELPSRLLHEATLTNSDPLGFQLVRLCRDHVNQPFNPIIQPLDATPDKLSETLQERLRPRYSPRDLERLLAYGNVETRRAATLGIGLIGDVQSQPLIATALHDPDEDVRRFAEQSSRNIWIRLGSSEHQARFARIHEAARNQDLLGAASQADSLIKVAPDYAEAWNARATIYFLLKRYSDAIPDCRQTLVLNPYHFGAASGMAQCHLQLDQIPEAIDALKLTAKLHPFLPGLQEQISVLENAIRNK